MFLVKGVIEVKNLKESSSCPISIIPIIIYILIGANSLGNGSYKQLLADELSLSFKNIYMACLCYLVNFIVI